MRMAKLAAVLAAAALCAACLSGCFLSNGIKVPPPDPFPSSSSYQPQNVFDEMCRWLDARVSGADGEGFTKLDLMPEGSMVFDVSQKVVEGYFTFEPIDVEDIDDPSDPYSSAMRRLEYQRSFAWFREGRSFSVVVRYEKSTGTTANYNSAKLFLNFSVFDNERKSTCFSCIYDPQERKRLEVFVDAERGLPAEEIEDLAQGYFDAYVESYLRAKPDSEFSAENLGEWNQKASSRGDIIYA